jgi:TonB family protein
VSNVGVQFVLWLLFAYPCFPQTAADKAADGDAALRTEQVRLSEILISTPQPYDPAQVAEARHKAEEVREAIRRGGAFADLARAISQGPTAAQGGDLGCFVRGKMARSLDEIIFQMGAGNVSDVIRTKQGFVIVEVTDRGQHVCPDLEVLNQPITADLKPYLEELKQKVRQRWYKLIPKSARAPELKQGSVTIQFSVQRNGEINDQRIASTSGYNDLDEAALKAIRKAGPFPPFPSTIKTSRLLMRFYFQYNPSKGTGL